MNHRRRRTRRPGKFTGPLAEPVRLKLHYSTLAGGSLEEARQRNIEEHQRAFREWLSKFDLLFAHYGVSIENRSWNDRDWPDLVARMAVDLIPGFRVVSAETRGRGHPTSSPFEDICLLVDAELVKQGLRSDGSVVSDGAAAEVLQDEPPYKARWGRLSVDTLRNKLSMARRSENPLAKFWRLEGEVRQIAREGLIEMFGATRQNIFKKR